MLLNKRILNTVIFFGLLLLAAPFVFIGLLEPLSKKAFGQIARELTAAQIATVKIDFDNVRLKNLSSIEWENFKVFTLFGGGDNLLSRKSLLLQAPRFILERKKNRPHFFGLRLEGAELLAYQPGTKEIAQHAQLRYAEAETALNLIEPAVFKNQTQFIVSEIKRFLFSGSTKIPLRLSAVSRFKISDKAMEAELEVIEEEENYRLVMSSADLARISLQLAEKLTANEIRSISRHPLQAPKMLEIRDQASLAAKNMAQADPRFPEDAYRHIYWSYLLTREFSEKLSEEMTTAHETGSANSEEDTQMDLNNNRLGREYARQGVSPDELLRKVFEDPAVIRSTKPELRAQPQENEGLAERHQPPEPSLSVAENTVQEPEGRIQARV